MSNKIKFAVVDIDPKNEKLFFFCKVSFPDADAKKAFLLRSQQQPEEWDTKLSNWVTLPKSLEIEAYIEVRKEESKDFLTLITAFVSGWSHPLSFWQKTKNLINKPRWWWKVRKLTK
jgi:hypothetical protein